MSQKFWYHKFWRILGSAAASSHDPPPHSSGSGRNKKKGTLDLSFKNCEFCFLQNFCWQQNFKFWILGLRISNFVILSNLGLFRVKDFKFAVFVQFLSKIEIFVRQIQILVARVKDFKIWVLLGLRIIQIFQISSNSKFHQNHKMCQNHHKFCGS